MKRTDETGPLGSRRPHGVAVTLGEPLAIGLHLARVRGERRAAEADEIRRRADLSGASLHYPCCEPE